MGPPTASTPSAMSSIAQYRPQSPSPDSPPATPPFEASSALSGKPGPFLMSQHERVSPDTSPASSASPSFITPLSSGRPSVVEEVGSDDERIRVTYPTEREVVAAFNAKQSAALDMSRTQSAQSAHSIQSLASSADWTTPLNPQEYAPIRPRSTSPHPPHLQTAFATTSSYTSHQHEPRERVVSPTLRTGFFGHFPPDSCSPSSPAADGKKEPSVKLPIGLGLGAQVSFDTGSSFESIGHSQSQARPRNPNSLQVFPQPANSYYPVNQATGSYKEHGTGVHAKQEFTDTVGYWLGLYFVFNLGLTLFNKMVLVSFPFPYTLTGLHALSGCAGCYFALERGAFTPARLTQKENLILAAFSVLYTINIAVSNISLQLVTVPFHQVVRASTPLFTLLISAVVLRTRFTTSKLVSLLPVVAGVGFATYGDYYFTAWGLILTLLGTLLAAFKTVVTNLIQTGGNGRLKLHPLDLLMRMSPLAFIQCVVYGWYTGELERVRAYGATQMTSGKAAALLINGAIACGLNIVSFTANKKAGALTMTVSANCKQVLTIALAVFLFDLSITPTNGIGIFLTLVGGGWYGYVEYTEKRKRANKIERS